MIQPDTCQQSPDFQEKITSVLVPSIICVFSAHVSGIYGKLLLKYTLSHSSEKEATSA